MLQHGIVHGALFLDPPQQFGASTAPASIRRNLCLHNCAAAQVHPAQARSSVTTRLRTMWSRVATTIRTRRSESANSSRCSSSCDDFGRAAAMPTLRVISVSTRKQWRHASSSDSPDCIWLKMRSRSVAESGLAETLRRNREMPYPSGCGQRRCAAEPENRHPPGPP